MYAKVIVFTLAVNYVTAYALNKEFAQNEDNSEYFRILSDYQRRLQSEGIYSSHFQDFLPSSFDELSVLQLIPVTIKQLRHAQLSKEECHALRKIFGNLWDIILEESRRKNSDVQNPVLSILLNSREIRHNSREIYKQLNSDVSGNSVQKVFTTGNAKPIHLSDDTAVKPSQRLLRMVAAIVQKVYNERSHQTFSPNTKPGQSKSVTLENAKVTIKVPRIKRSPFAVISTNNELDSTVQPQANQAGGTKGDQPDIHNDGSIHSSNSMEDDDDYYEDDYYPEHVKDMRENVVTDDTANEINKQKQDKSELISSQDYAYDESEDEDDYFWDIFKPRFSPGQFENPSFNELIMLAARHRANKQLLLGKKSKNYKTIASDEFEDDY
ncbi:uncharacterized protein LOC131437136 [Malaya genurostris]|uniref:uncharacterized protein LOC131437136 n=1 Tax=Malaya genurostris TaxID=325434 RepID=UPI0026F3B075|nr:uncharacterized protein LOC131437136 [Malaya genurostris]